MEAKKEIQIGDNCLSVEIGKVARQANASVWVKYDDSVVLVSVVSEKEARELRGWMPLTVDYREKAYSMGKIPVFHQKASEMGMGHSKIFWFKLV